MAHEDVASVKINFLYKAIDDAQQTIRHIDTKTSILTVIIGVIISKIGSGISDFVKYIDEMPPALFLFYWVVIAIYLITVIIMLLIFLNIIFPNSNPNTHIMPCHYKPKGLFYLWGLNFGWRDILSDFDKTRMQTSFNEYTANLSEVLEIKHIEEELTYELLKVSYIREIKLRRSRYLIKVIVVALYLSVILLYLHFIGLSDYMPPFQSATD